MDEHELFQFIHYSILETKEYVIETIHDKNEKRLEI